MAKQDVKRFAPDPESLWACPCGVQMVWRKILGHRRGWNSRPACRGTVHPVEEQEAPEAASPTASASLLHPAPYEYTGFDEEEDPEEAARLAMLSQKEYEQRALFDSEDDSDGGGPSSPGVEGGFAYEPPPVTPPVQTARETVVLPVVARVIYEWAVSQGWNRGNGTMSDFMTDILLDHFQNCWGKGIFIADRDEILGEG